jgi:hypothetical protein
VVDGDLEEALNLRAVQVHGKNAVGAGGLDTVGTDTGSDRHPRLVLFVSLGIREIGNDCRHLSGAGSLERVDPEEELDEIVVDGVVGPLHDENVAAAHVFEHPDENISFAEDVDFRARQVHPQIVADRSPERLARAAGEYLQFTVGIGLFGGIVVEDQGFVHAHGGRSAIPVVRKPPTSADHAQASPRAAPQARSLVLN